MRKAIVLYNSRGGNTEKVAKKIAEGLGAECYNNKNIPDLQNFDLIVLGSWVIAGRISFAGSRYLKKLRRKNINGKKIALFFTSGAPDEINPMTEETNPRLIKDIMFETMEKILTKNNQVSILSDRFYSKGTVRIFKHGKPKEPLGHPSDEDLSQAKAFGELLKKNI